MMVSRTLCDYSFLSDIIMDALGLDTRGISLGMASVVYSGYVTGQTTATVSVDWDIGVLCGAGHQQYAYIGSPILFVAGSTIRANIVPLSGDMNSVNTEYIIFSVNSNKQSFTVQSSLVDGKYGTPAVSFYLAKYD